MQIFVRLCVLLQTRHLWLFATLKTRNGLNWTLLTHNNTGYFYTKCNGRVVITLTLEDRLWKRVCTMWEWDRYDGTRGLKLRIVTLTPLHPYLKIIQMKRSTLIWTQNRIVTGFSSRLPMFLPMPVHMGFVMDKVVLRQLFLPVLRTRTTLSVYSTSSP
jgi:hypothetical protein